MAFSTAGGGAKASAERLSASIMAVVDRARDGDEAECPLDQPRHRAKHLGVETGAHGHG